MTLPENTFDETVAALKRGGVALFPTDTVYGVGVSIAHAASPEALYVLKERDRAKPIAWLVADEQALHTYGEDVPAWALELAQREWPGALTLIVRASDAVPIAYRSAQGTIGLRMPASDVALALIRSVGAPLATSSANRAGNPAPATSSEIDEAFACRADAVLATGDIPASGCASTVVDCTHDAPVIIRQGDVRIV